MKPPPSVASIPHLKASIITLKNNDFRLTSNISDELKKLRRDHEGEKATLKSWDIKSKHASKIDWVALDKTMTTCNKQQYGGAVKCEHRLWDTSRRKQDWGQGMSGICTHCNQEKETYDHALQCPATRKIRKIFFSELNAGMKNIKAYSLLQRWVMIMIQQWAGGHPITLPPKSMLVTRCIRRAMKRQKKLGYNNSLCGILSEKWDEVQQQFEKTKNKDNPGKFRLYHWSRVVSKLYIECCVKIWRYHCEMVHLKKEGNVGDVLRSKLPAYVLSFQDTSWLLRSRDCHLTPIC